MPNSFADRPARRLFADFLTDTFEHPREEVGEEAVGRQVAHTGHVPVLLDLLHPTRAQGQPHPHLACSRHPQEYPAAAAPVEPYCQHSANFRDLANNYSSSQTAYWYQESAKTASLSNPSFYVMTLKGVRAYKPMDENYWLNPANVMTAPHWMIVNGDKSGVWDQPRWPVLDVKTSAITCTTLGIYSGESSSVQQVPLKKTNGGGAYSMCGDDMAAWLSTWLPPAPPVWPPAK